MLRDQLVGGEIVWDLVLGGTVWGGALDRCGGWHSGGGVQPPGEEPMLDSLARDHRQG